MKIINSSYKIISESFSDIRIVIKYFFSGLFGIFTNLVVLYFFTEITHLWYVFSAMISFIFGFIVTFLLQKFWTFNNHGRSGISKQAIWYFFIALLNLVFNIIILYILVDFLGFWYIGSQSVTLVFIVGLSFLLNKNITFKKSPEGVD